MNSNNDIKAALDRQEFLLKEIATTQTEILAVEKQRLRTEQYQIIGKVLHTLFWIILLWVSFVQLQKFSQVLTDRFLAGNQNATSGIDLLNGAKSTTNLLNQMLKY